MGDFNPWLWLRRLRMRLGGISVWVCPVCATVMYWPAFFRETSCCGTALRLGPRDWGYPRGAGKR